jgi:hypothetical protein
LTRKAAGPHHDGTGQRINATLGHYRNSITSAPRSTVVPRRGCGTTVMVWPAGLWYRQADGSWNNDATNCRAANRNSNAPDNRNNNIGFRPLSANRRHFG